MWNPSPLETVSLHTELFPVGVQQCGALLNVERTKLSSNHKNSHITEDPALSGFFVSLVAVHYHDPRLTGAWIGPGSAVELEFSYSPACHGPARPPSSGMAQEPPHRWASHAPAWGKCLQVQWSLQKLLQSEMPLAFCGFPWSAALPQVQFWWFQWISGFSISMPLSSFLPSVLLRDLSPWVALGYLYLVLLIYRLL